MAARKTSDERKAEILEATLRLADKVGPERLSTESIAREVGLTQPGIFRHFPTKQSLWEAVAEAIAKRMNLLWRAAFERSDRPEERLAGIILAQLRLIQETPAIPAILFSRELHTRNDILRKALFRLLKRFHATIAAEVKAAVDAGRFRSDINAEDAAFLLIGMVQGLAVRWSLSGRQFDLPAEGKRLLDLQLALFAAPAAMEAHS